MGAGDKGPGIKDSAKKIAVYGGAFDPPHVGHMFVITALLNTEGIDEVWLVPAGDDRYDRPVNAAAHDRLKMVEILRGEYGECASKILIETVQLEGKLPGSATINLIDNLRSRFPQHEFFFVIGADNVKAVPSWREYERLLRAVKFLIVSRHGVPMPDKLPGNMKFISAHEDAATDISSTTVRVLLKKVKCAAGYVPAKILSYIAERGLYK